MARDEISYMISQIIGPRTILDAEVKAGGSIGSKSRDPCDRDIISWGYEITQSGIDRRPEYYGRFTFVLLIDSESRFDFM